MVCTHHSHKKRTRRGSWRMKRRLAERERKVNGGLTQLIPRSLFLKHFTFFNEFLGSDTQEVSHAPMRAFSNPLPKILEAISHKNITSLVHCPHSVPPTWSALHFLSPTSPQDTMCSDHEYAVTWKGPYQGASACDHK